MRNHRRSRCLGNFLSGMETINSEQQRKDDHALETSLVEWKRPCRIGRGSLVYSLETSLVEWKHEDRSVIMHSRHALETSLVEWKPCSLRRLNVSPNSLGNFLSGMETYRGGSAG